MFFKNGCYRSARCYLSDRGKRLHLIFTLGSAFFVLSLRVIDLARLAAGFLLPAKPASTNTTPFTE